MVVMSAQSGIVGIALAALIFVAGHGFNLIINVLGAYVHASRLQYVEFFTKFMTAAAECSRPLESLPSILILNWKKGRLKGKWKVLS